MNYLICIARKVLEALQLREFDRDTDQFERELMSSSITARIRNQASTQEHMRHGF